MRTRCVFLVGWLTTSVLLDSVPMVANAWGGGIMPKGPQTLTSRRGFWQTAASVTAATAAVVVGNQKANALEPFIPLPHSMDNKVVVITGGTAGLGLESSKRLAAGGATVVLTSRSVTKGQAAIQAVQDYLAQHGITNDRVYSVNLDLDDLDNVKSFPNRLAKSPALANSKTVNVLMNNAGVMAIPDRQLTKDNLERTFQSNHLGHFCLTAKLLPMLANDALIINVSSLAYQIASSQGGLQLDNLNGETNYGPWTSYGQSKLANILFTKELQKRAEAAGRPLTVVSLHPGAVRTDLPRYLVGEEKFANLQQNAPSWKDSLLLNVLSFVTVSVEEGATTQVWLAARQGGDDIGGQFFVQSKPVQTASAANDMTQANALWTLSEKLAGVEFKL